MPLPVTMLRPTRALAGLLLLAGASARADAAAADASVPASVAAPVFVEYQLASPRPDLARIKAAGIEKPVLKFGMIKLTDCAPLVVARELGFFAAEGLSVAIEVQANWKVVQERVVSMELDGSHMLYNHPIGARIGYLGQAKIICPFNISINGKGITVSTALWKAMQDKDPGLKEPGYPLPVAATSLKAIAKERFAAGNPLRFGMTFPSGSHNIALRYWLAAGGVNPNTMVAVVKALIRANQWLDEGTEHRKLACEMLANKAYIGANVEVLAESMLGTYQYQKGDRREARDFNIFYRRFASFPFKSHTVWGLTQARRWGMIATSMPDAWYGEVADRISRSDIYRKAFALLLAEGKVEAEDLPADDYQSSPAEAFIDHIAFDPRHPNAYLQKFAIGLK